MDIYKKLEQHLIEAMVHINRLETALNTLEKLYPLDNAKLENLSPEDIDIWSEFRGVRNSISHDYPFEESQKLEAINYLIENVKYLTDITKKIKDNFETISTRDWTY